MSVSSTPTYAQVKVQGQKAPVSIPVTSFDKPEISTIVKNKWQKLINVVTQCIEVPAGLIMQISNDRISVFISSETADNPYKQNAHDNLLHGLYCETVLGTNRQLLVPNALNDEHWNNNPDIELGMVSYLGFPVSWPDGEFFGTICVLDNKTNTYKDHLIQLMSFCKSIIEDDLHNTLLTTHELRTANQRLMAKIEELQNSYEQLSVAHQEKILLLQEVNHRVKNNLQIIIGLIQLQMAGIDDEQAQNKLVTIVDRIYSMGIVYEVLYNTNNFTQINIKSYLQAIITHLISSHSRENQVITPNINIDDDIIINLETAVPIGLIVNELITNSIKYAFPDERMAEININLQHKKNGYCMTIKDNGVGIPDTVDFDKEHGLGFQIIEALSKQLNGSIHIERGNNTVFRVLFNILKKEEKRWTKKES